MIFMLYSSYHEERVQAYQTLAILCLCIISVMFWAFYFQMFLSLVLFISRLVNPKFISISFPPPYYVAIESIGMILIGWLITKIKPKENNLQVQAKNFANKFTLSMFLMLITYLLILGVSYFSPANHLISPLFLIPAYLIISLAELLLSPVGIAAVTILAAREKVSTMMGIFFVSLGLGGYLSGKLANLTAVPENITSMETIKNLYYIGFSKLFFILTGCLVLTLVLRQLIHHLINKLSSPIIIR
jgi:POT family proton-dependent oligopeptide transporter